MSIITEGMPVSEEACAMSFIDQAIPESWSDLLQSLPQAIVLFDELQQVVFANRCAIELIPALETFAENETSESNYQWLRDALKPLFDDSRESGREFQFQIPHSTSKRFIAKLSKLSGDFDKQLSFVSFYDNSQNVQNALELERDSVRYRTIIENAPFSIVRYHLHSNDVEVLNSNIAWQSGYSIDEFKELFLQSDRNLCHPEDIDRVNCEVSLWKKQNATGVLHLEYRGLKKDGSVVWLKVDCFVERDSSGRVATINQIYHDISDIKFYEKAKRDTVHDDYRQTINNLHTLVLQFVKNEEGDIVYQLREGKLAEGYTTDAVKGKKPTDVFQDKDMPLLMEKLEQAFEGTSSEFATRINNRDYIYRYEPVIENGLVSKVIGSVFDITERREHEEKLRQLLRQEKQLNLLKSGFLQTVSHEFRTPLTGILVNIDLLDDYFERFTEIERRDLIGQIRSRATEISQLVSDCVGIADINEMKSQLRMQKFDLVALFEKVLDEFEDELKSRDMKAVKSFESSPHLVNADEAMMRIAVRALIKNSISYSSRGSHINVSIEKVGDRVLARVTDYGIGIPSTELTSVFDPFYRASNVGGVSGIGMGLSIAKELVDINRGSISITSQVNQGTETMIALPVE